MLLAGYLLLAEYAGGFVARYNGQLWLEAILVLYLYGLAYAVLRPSRWRACLAAVPLLLLYMTSDIFYLAFYWNIDLIITLLFFSPFFFKFYPFSFNPFER